MITSCVKKQRKDVLAKAEKRAADMEAILVRANKEYFRVLGGRWKTGELGAWIELYSSTVRVSV